MVVRQETRPGAGAADEPPEFVAAVATMRAARLRPEIHCEEMPAPQRIAPFAAALSADVTVDGEEIGTGRIILLHDPLGNDAWDGEFRCVAYARAEIDVELITDPMLAGGRLDLAHRRPRRARRDLPHGVGHSDTRGDGELRGDGRGQRRRTAGDPRLVDAGRPVAASELGADLDIGPHVEAWGELLCTAVGLPPVPDGVAVIPSRRGQRGSGA